MKIVAIAKIRRALRDLVNIVWRRSEDVRLFAEVERPGQPTSPHKSINFSHENRPKFGSAKGMIQIADDFDDPLPDFEEYMS